MEGHMQTKRAEGCSVINQISVFKVNNGDSSPDATHQGVMYQRKRWLDTTYPVEMNGGFTCLSA